MDKKRVLLITGGVIIILALCAASFVVASKFYIDQDNAEVTEQPPQDDLFAPTIFSNRISCALAPEDAGRQSTFAAFTIESPDPGATADTIRTLFAKYQNSRVTASHYTYDDSIDYNTTENLYLNAYVPVAYTDEVIAALKRLHQGQVYIVTHNVNSDHAERIQEDCEYDLAEIKLLELKEAAYLEQLKKGGLSQQAVDDLVIGLDDARTFYQTIMNDNRVDVRSRLDETRIYIDLLLPRG